MKTPAIWQPVANRNGAVIIIVALAILGLVGVVGLALDLGFTYGVKGQLQAAADASALAGADRIYPANTSTPLSSFPEPEWAGVKAATTAFVKQNKVAGLTLSDDDIVEIKTGYWNLDRDPDKIQEGGTPPTGVCSENKNRSCTTSKECDEGCLINDIPAIQVTLRKSLPALFSKAVGSDGFTPAVTAIATLGYPKTGRSIFPIAVTKCMVDSYFTQSPMPTPPAQIELGGPYNPGGTNCNSGQWTSLNAGKSDVPTMKALMYSTLPLPPMKIGEQIWIDTGAKDGLFQDIENDFVGRVVELPVVKDAVLATNTKTPIIGFVYFRIKGTTKAPKQIYGHFEAYYKDENRSSPGGPKYNGVTHPMLVK